MNQGKIIFLLALLCLIGTYTAQYDGADYKTHITFPVNEERVSRNINCEYYTTYLGEMKILGTNKCFHIIRQFYTVQAAISKHGHSNLILFEETTNLLWIVEFDMPDQLPIGIISNFWIFENEGQKKYQFFRWTDLIVLCHPDNGCGEVYYKTWEEQDPNNIIDNFDYPNLEFKENAAFQYDKQISAIQNEFNTWHDNEGWDHDSLIDMNFDGELDYVIRFYGTCGNGIKDRMHVFYRNVRSGKFEFANELDLGNPSFSTNRKRMYWFYLPNGVGQMGEMKWNGKKWIDVYYYYADNQGEATVWQKYNRNDILIDEISLPYQGVPPEVLLPQGNYW